MFAYFNESGQQLIATLFIQPVISPLCDCRIEKDSRMNPPINRIVLYAKDVEKMVAFYETYFGFQSQIEEGDRIVELIPPSGGARLMIHPAGKGIREGQACVKLVFDVLDVENFREECSEKGLEFGAIHRADGYVFSNAKDPGKNSIQISSRAFRHSA